MLIRRCGVYLVGKSFLGRRCDVCFPVCLLRLTRLVWAPRQRFFFRIQDCDPGPCANEFDERGVSLKEARDALVAAGLAPERGGRIPRVEQFLNRLLGASLSQQNHLFDS